jgi:hypothetical protein
MTQPEAPASVLAENAAQQWRALVHHQRSATPNHGEIYTLAGELVDALRSLESLTRVLNRQVCSYGQGRVLRDDTGGDPYARLAEACLHLNDTTDLLAGAERSLNEFWSSIGHIATEEHRP